MKTYEKERKVGEKESDEMLDEIRNAFEEVFNKMQKKHPDLLIVVGIALTDKGLGCTIIEGMGSRNDVAGILMRASQGFYDTINELENK